MRVWVVMYIETSYEYTIKKIFSTPEAANSWIMMQEDSGNYDATEWEVTK